MNYYIRVVEAFSDLNKAPKRVSESKSLNYLIV